MINKDCENGEKLEPQLHQGHDEKCSTEVSYNKKDSYLEDETAVVKDYQKEAPRKLRFQALNRNLEYVPVHKVSKSCSPKVSGTNPQLDDNDVNQQSTALKKKRERYHSQRKKAIPSSNSDHIVSGQTPISVTKRTSSPCQDHPLGNNNFKTI